MFRFNTMMLTDEIRRSVALIAVRAGYCASCGYVLPDTPNTDAGLHRCSECGAAWRKGAVE